MSFLWTIESWGEGVLRIAIGTGLAWIGVIEGAGDGLFLQVVGGVFILAGIGEIWMAEAAEPQFVPAEKHMRTIHSASVKCEIPVFYATSEGQTRRIAERLVAIFRKEGLTSEAFDVSAVGGVDWQRVRAAVVGASLHVGRHQRSAERFVRVHAADLNAHPSAFFSVSLATASPASSERAEAARLASRFPDRAGWHPREIACIAGRCAYTQYDFVTRLVMRRIARRRGAPTDTSRDFEFTDWADVARLARAVVRMVKATTRQAA
jgi:menaquinone-dependent protoporphyrinogen oxidase